MLTIILIKNFGMHRNKKRQIGTVDISKTHKDEKIAWICCHPLDIFKGKGTEVNREKTILQVSANGSQK